MIYLPTLQWGNIIINITITSKVNRERPYKHPLQRSAFTFSENYIPSRLDFAKERFGGPFTTEQVENVKTFLSILLIIFALGPACVCMASYLIFSLFEVHSLHQYTYHKEYCTSSYKIIFLGGNDWKWNSNDYYSNIDCHSLSCLHIHHFLPS